MIDLGAKLSCLLEVFFVKPTFVEVWATAELDGRILSNKIILGKWSGLQDISLSETVTTEMNQEAVWGIAVLYAYIMCYISHGEWENLFPQWNCLAITQRTYKVLKTCKASTTKIFFSYREILTK